MIEQPPFLGSGWAYPPAFAGHGAQVATASGQEDIEQSLHILLSTIPGERVMHTRYGCELNRYLFEEVDQSLLTNLKNEITEAIIDYEPRITVDQVTITNDMLQGLLLIHIDYTIKATNSRYNLVFPFYINEAASNALTQ